MRNLVLLFASILVFASCSKDDGVVEEALITKDALLTKKGVQDTGLSSKSGFKVSICHKDAGDIVVSESALATHIAHEDAVDRDGDGFYDKENPCSVEIDCNDYSYSKDNNCEPATLGDLRAGGIVFWVDPSDNRHGLVCAIEDQSPPNGIWLWDNAVSLSNNYSVIVNSIVYDDWYLPSKNKLNEMYLNKVAINTTATVNGGSVFSDTFPYWSSTEGDNYDTWLQYFRIGLQVNGSKYNTGYVRAVRAF